MVIEGAALDLEAAYRAFRQPAKIIGLGRGEVTFCRHMVAYWAADIFIESVRQKGGPGILVKGIFFARDYCSCVRVDQVADIMQQCRRDHRRAGRGVLPLRCALQCMLQLSYRIAVVVILVALFL